MAQQQLDLFQLAARRTAQLRAGATTVMGRNSGDTRSCGVWLKELPDDLFAQADALRLAGAVHRSEHVSVSTLVQDSSYSAPLPKV